MKNKRFYRRKLPHLQPAEGTFFITYRLFGSIPKSVIQSIQDSFELEISNLKEELFQKNNSKSNSKKLEKQLLFIFKKKKYDLRKMSFKKYDDYLDNNLNEPYWLGNETITQLNLDALNFYNNQKYKLWAATIMSNHIHVLFTLLPQAPPLWKVMKDLKSYTGKKGNIILDRTGKGKFWEEESYDHLVRKGEFDRILFYILNNPVKAKLVKVWQEWPWNYCHPDLLQQYRTP